MIETRTRTEEIRVSGECLLEKLRELVHTGNLRSIELKSEEGHTTVIERVLRIMNYAQFYASHCNRSPAVS